MDMIGHQTVGPHLGPAFTARLRNQGTISAVIVMTEKRLLAPVTPLRDPEFRVS